MTTTITKQTMAQLQTQLQEVLSQMNLPQQLKITVGRGSYSASNATFKIEIATLNEDGTSNTREAKDFLAHCVFNSDLKKEWLNKATSVRGKQYTIIGYKRANRKYPFLVTSNGKTYKMSLQQVLASWK